MFTCSGLRGLSFILLFFFFIGSAEFRGLQLVVYKDVGGFKNSMKSKGGVEASNFILDTCLFFFTRRREWEEVQLPTGFFNRTREIQMMSSLLKSDPQLLILTGPVNSGKSVLLRKVILELKNKESTPVLYINLRNVSFNSVDSFITILQHKLANWLQQFKEAAKTFNLNASAYGFGLKISRSEGVAASPINRLDLLFERISAKIPPHTFWGKLQIPIFVINEANKLSALTKDPSSQDAILNLFKWLILNTKELGRFHTILVSSDSFFHLWVSGFIGTSRYANYVIGDLPKKDAEEFWQNKLFPAIRNKAIVLPDFNDIYKVWRQYFSA